MKKAISAVVIIGLIVLLFNLSEKNKKDKNISDFSNNSNSNSKDLLENEKLEDVIEYNDKDKEKKEVSLEDFDIRYIHVPVQNRDFVLVTNKSKITSTLKINSVVKDINGKMLSIDEKYISPVGSGETVIGSLSCSKNDEQDLRSAFAEKICKNFVSRHFPVPLGIGKCFFVPAHSAVISTVGFRSIYDRRIHFVKRSVVLFHIFARELYCFAVLFAR